MCSVLHCAKGQDLQNNRLREKQAWNLPRIFILECSKRVSETLTPGARVINSTTYSGHLRSIPTSVLSCLIVVFTFHEDPVETVCRVKSGFQKARLWWLVRRWDWRELYSEKYVGVRLCISF